MSLEEEIYGGRKLKKGIKIFIIIFIILGFIIGGLFAFQYLFNNPYNVYKSIINKTHDNIINFLNDSEEKSIDLSSIDILRNEYNFKIQTSIPELKEFANYKYNIENIIDFKQEKYEQKMKISDSEKEQKIFDIGFYYDKDKTLFASDTMYNKSVELPLENQAELFSSVEDIINLMHSNINTKDLKYAITSIKDSMLKAIDKKSLKSKFDKIKIDNEYINVLRFDYEFDKKVLNEVYNILTDDLLKNYEFIAIISKLLEVTPDEVEKLIKEQKDSFTKADSFTISIYKKVFSSKVIKFELETADEMSITYFDDVIEINYKKEELKLDMSNKVKILTYQNNEKEIINFEINKIDSNLIDMKYTINIEEHNISGELYLNCKKKSETSLFSDISFSLMTKINGQDIHFRIFGSLANYKVDKLSLINTDDTIKINDLDINTLTNIFNKGKDALKGTPFENIYNMILF